MTTPWSHGYNAQVQYTFGYYRETDPRWLDFAALITGHWPPEPLPGEPLRLLDLGCGQGFGLCLTASLHPEMEFVGIDFNPAHIAHAQGLARRAGLANVRFVEGDFVELGRHWPAELGRFHYVVLHGIWSWIAPPVRTGAVAAINQCLVPGGLVYNSYNAQPGWHAGSILRALLMAVSAGESDQTQIEALRRAIDTAKQLENAGAAVFRAYPGIAQRLKMLERHDLRYVANEYINEAHQIFWGHEVAAEMAPAKLGCIASATLPENYLPALLPPQQAEIVNRFTHPGIRHLLVDLIINQAFRRDLFQRGVVQNTRGPQLARLGALRVIGTKSEKREAKFSLSFGEVSGREEVYGPLFERLDEGPRSIAELMQQHPAKPQAAGIAQAISLGLWDQRLAFAQPAAIPPSAQAFNRAVLASQREGRFYDWIAAPATCQGIAVQPIERLVLAALLLDHAPATREAILPAVVRDVDWLGLNIEDEGKRLEGEARQNKLAESVGEILAKRLPVWAHLGVV